MFGHGQLGTLVGKSCQKISSKGCPWADSVSGCVTQKSWWIIRSFPAKSNIRIKQGGLEEGGAGGPAAWHSRDGIGSVLQVLHPLLLGSTLPGRNKRNTAPSRGGHGKGDFILQEVSKVSSPAGTPRAVHPDVCARVGSL